jgi:hypothetical protein
VGGLADQIILQIKSSQSATHKLITHVTEAKYKKMELLMWQARPININ